jgi:hypothetical protein
MGAAVLTEKTASPERNAVTWVASLQWLARRTHWVVNPSFHTLPKSREAGSAARQRLPRTVRVTGTSSDEAPWGALCSRFSKPWKRPAISSAAVKSTGSLTVFPGATTNSLMPGFIQRMELPRKSKVFPIISNTSPPHIPSTG